jgi:hypothetical protein
METSHWSGQWPLDAGAVLLPYRAPSTKINELPRALFENAFWPRVTRQIRLDTGHFLGLGSGVYCFLSAA